MTQGEFHTFLLFVVGLCVLMAILNLVFRKNKGWFLAGAFLALGAGALVYRADADSPMVWVMGAGTLALLVGDVLAKAKRNTGVSS
ncbi:MAG TPA: hypothetical protein VJ835_00570 [Fimbriimonadaceae bacterium]|nr:hypothetical protein [Fimbriimonadaceae bacterium]